MVKKKLNIKKIKQICSVPGCANRGSYTMARTRAFGGVHICEDCIREALAFIAPIVPPTLKDLLLDDRFKEELKKAIEDGVKDGVERIKSGNNAPITPLTDIPLQSGDTFENGNVNDDKGDIPDGLPSDSDVENTQTNDGDNEEQQPEAEKYVCSKCGKICASQSGLTNHEKACGNK